MKLNDYLDTDKLAKYVESGLVTVRSHDTLPLSIYCYGRTAVFDNVWDDITCKTRGLIVEDGTNEIIARPYEKFFSLEQMAAIKQPIDVEHLDELYGPPVITEKVNGCLGIFWKYGVHWGIASKGSFHSPHAAFATKWMEDHIENNGKLVFPEGFTPVFEIICQEIQPHVIKYPEDGLVLLNFVKLETGEELDSRESDKYALKNKLFEPILFAGPLDYFLNDDNDTFEGYVATYNRPGQPPLKLKIKFPTFLASRKKFYAERKEKELVVTTDWKLGRYAEIHKAAANILQDALVHCTERHEFIAYFNQPDNKRYRAVCIAMLDTNTKKYQELIWKMVDNGK
jgi:tRNA splicing ligase